MCVINHASIHPAILSALSAAAVSTAATALYPSTHPSFGRFGLLCEELSDQCGGAFSSTAEQALITPTHF